jgi:tetratricopeptide (TPR) repeat protein
MWWSYNNCVLFKSAVAVAFLSVSMFAQSTPPSSPSPTSCPANRPVDDIIAEVQSQQSKKRHRNSNPFPDVTCIWGWCRDHSKTPPTVPGNIPSSDASGGEPSSDNPTPDEVQPSQCDEAMEKALDAAHNVEVGDYSFAEKNYNGALMRYKTAVEEKPEDIAIHVRLGRVYERLKQDPQAIEQYNAALKLSGPAKWRDEAKAALARLERPRS